MARVMRVIGRIFLWSFATIGFAATTFILLNWGLFTSMVSAYDRLYIRPCYYYPNAFIDCATKKEE